MSGVLRIGSGAAAAQLVALGSVPVLSRIYSPSEVGVFATVISIATIFSIVAPLRLDSAIQVAEWRSVPVLVLLALTSSLAIGVLCTVVVRSHIGGLPGSPPSGHVALLLVGAFTFATGVFAVLSSLLLRERDYGLIGSRNLVRQVATSAGQIGGPVAGPGWTGLLLGALVGQVVGLALMARRAGAILRSAPRRTFGSRGLALYWRFPVVLAPSALLNAVGIQIPLLFVAREFGSQDAGNLSQALRIGAAPAVVIGVAVSSVLLSEMSRGIREGATHQRAAFLRTSFVLGAAGTLWLVTLLVVLPPVLPFLLGAGWETSGSYMRAIAISAAASLVVAPLSSVLIAYQKAWTVLFLDVGRIALTVGGGVAGVILGLSAPMTCLLISIGSAVAYAATWSVCLAAVSDRQAAGESGQGASRNPPSDADDQKER